MRTVEYYRPVMDDEKAEFLPLICTDCFGEMHSQKFAEKLQNARDSSGCYVCARAFMSYTWRLNSVNRSLRVCKPCCLERNICQSCIYPLDFNTPIEVIKSFFVRRVRVDEREDPAREIIVSDFPVIDHLVNRAGPPRCELLVKIRKEPRTLFNGPLVWF